LPQRSDRELSVAHSIFVVQTVGVIQQVTVRHSIYHAVSTARYHERQMRALHSLGLFSLPACAICCAIGLIGCRPLPPSKPASEWTPEEAQGAQVYQAKCARCHYPTTSQSLHGPGLQALTKLKAMPSGAPPTDERLTAVILNGRQMMPATPMTDEQLSDLLAYLHTL
jgi:mono/diheme cytochrome c family protein